MVTIENGKCPKVVISGWGLFQPSQVIDNAQLVQSFNAYADLYNQTYKEAIEKGEKAAVPYSSTEFIEKASGIKQRFVMNKSGILDPARMFPYFEPRKDSELSLMAEIACHAAKKALESAELQGSDIDGVICAASNMQRAYPAMAVEIQQAVGAGGYGFDMNVACSSATFGIEQAVNAVKAGSARRVLVVNPEITSAHLEWRDRDCHFIFGDVCTAVIVERQDTAKSNEVFEILGTKLFTQFSNNIRNNFGFMNRSENKDPDARDTRFYQEGRKVFKEVVPLAAAHIQAHLQTLGYSAQSVRRFWLHQANLSMNQLVVKKLLDQEVNDDIAPIILNRYANTASAGSIIAFCEYNNDFVKGDLGVVCSFGAGYSIGSVVVRKL